LTDCATCATCIDCPGDDPFLVTRVLPRRPDLISRGGCYGPELQRKRSVRSGARSGTCHG
jgi:hypothetical protein